MIPLSVPNIGELERVAVHEALASGWVSTAGPDIRLFEENLAAFVGQPAAVAVASGTAGLHLALLTSGIAPGDEVIAPTLTFAAAVNPARYCGCHPVFFDCDDSLTIDPAKVRKFLEERCERRADGFTYNQKTGRRVYALMAVHIFGNLCDLESLMDLAERYNLYLIEDATEALGSFYTAGRYRGRHAGTVGRVGVYSFNGNKIITTGGGGMVVARDPAVLGRIRHLSTQAKADELYFIHDEIGYNYRLTNLQAALGVAQLRRLPEFIGIKKRNYLRYCENGLPLLPFRGGVSPNYWFYSLQTRDRRDGVMQSLKAEGIDSRPIWALLHTLAPYAGCEAFEIKRAVAYHRDIVNIPCSSSLTAEEVDTVSAAARRALQ